MPMMMYMGMMALAMRKSAWPQLSSDMVKVVVDASNRRVFKFAGAGWTCSHRHSDPLRVRVIVLFEPATTASYCQGSSTTTLAGIDITGCTPEV